MNEAINYSVSYTDSLLSVGSSVFTCNSCGACCKLLIKDHAPELDRGDGICINLKNNKCDIYESRPDKCRQGNSFDSKLMSRQDYDELSMKACKTLQEQIEC